MNIRKSKKANLESKRSIFLQIGFVISLAMVLFAFEWTSIDTNSFEWELDRGFLVDEEIYEIRILKEKPEPLKVKIVPPIFVSDDADFIDDDPLFDPEVSDKTENSLENNSEFVIEEIETEDNKIYDFVQKRPQYPGGESALYTFLRENLKYPHLAKEIGIKGKVLVSFVVWKDGSIRDVTIIRGLGSGCDEEVIRVINRMPRWEPGIQDGKKVNFNFRMPVLFNLR